MTLKDMLKIVPVVLIATLAFAGFCYADEEDEPLTKQYGLGEAPPPKPKVIKKVVTKTKIVNQCPTGFFWNEDARKCLDEDGNEAVPKRKQAAAAPPTPRQPVQPAKNDRYIYPGTKLRVKVDKCSMLGETVKCTFFVTNTAEGSTYTTFTDATLTDEFGSKYKSQSQEYLQGNKCSGTYYVLRVCYGDTATIQLTFPLVNPATNTVSIASLLEANAGSDFLKFEGINLLK